MNLWICGKDLGGVNGWEFQGVFDTEDKAVAACLTDDYFIGPATLNEQGVDDTVEWVGLYYPRLENSPEQ